jgi:hypothetical protein
MSSETWWRSISQRGTQERRWWPSSLLPLLLPTPSVRSISYRISFPVLGYLDDLVIVPLGILLVVRLIPPELMAEFRHEAIQRGRLPAHWGGAAVIMSLWLIGMGLAVWWGYHWHAL